MSGNACTENQRKHSRYGDTFEELLHADGLPR